MTDKSHIRVEPVQHHHQHRNMAQPAKKGIYVENEEDLPRDIMETKEEREHQWFVGSIDQGTTSTRFLIFNGKGEPVANYQMEFDNMYPESGLVFPPLPASPLFVFYPNWSIAKTSAQCC